MILPPAGGKVKRMPRQGCTAQTKRPRPTTPAARRVKLKSKGAKNMKLLNTAKKITTAAALAAAMLAGTAPKAAACPYTVGPLGRYIAPAIVQGMTATDDGAVEVWCTDALDGDDWYFVVDAETDLRIYDRVDLVVDANGTPEDFSDDKVIDALYCHGCTED
jgi:hypothetical protein